MIFSTENYNEKVIDTVKKQTFSNYVVDSSNQFAYSVVKEFASEGWQEGGQLIIYGPLGMGKRHLAHALMHVLVNQEENKQICYVDGNDYYKQLMQNDLDKADALFVMNADALSENSASAEELLDTLKHCWQEKKIVVITMKHNPQKLNVYYDKFCNTINITKVVKVESPEQNFCENMIRYWIKRDGFERFNFDNQTISYIARIGSESIRYLERTFLKVIASSVLEKQEITLDFAKTVLAGLDKDNNKYKNISCVV